MGMSEINDRTIAAYDASIQGYLDNTPHEVSRTSKAWLDASLRGLPSDARILEIGSGFGHDATYIEQQGFVVERTDATPGFVEFLRSQSHEARTLNVLRDKIDGPYDLVFADAVFHHLNRADTIIATSNILAGLVDDGRFAASLRLGLQEGWSEEKIGAPRFFSHWERADMMKVIKDVGFASIAATDGEHVSATWLHFIARK